jgi:hypothetical protein
MNAKLGKEKVFSHTLHNISNKNGEMVANYAISNVHVSNKYQLSTQENPYWNADIP